MWFVYILETLDEKLYTGITKDLERRFKQHKSGHGGRFTRTFGCKEMLYHEPQPTRSDALSREAHIKTWSRLKKLQLIKGVLKKKKVGMAKRLTTKVKSKSKR